LRTELAKKQANIDRGRREMQKIIEEKALELQKLELSKNAAIEVEKSDKAFMKRELDQVTEKLHSVQQRAKLVSDEGDSASNNKAVNKLDTSRLKPPPPKRARTSRSRLPENIDE
jgi:hypothetical protein